MCSLTFRSSGSHESKVRDRTLEKCTPRLLQVKEAHKRKHMALFIWNLYMGGLQMCRLSSINHKSIICTEGSSKKNMHYNSSTPLFVIFITSIESKCQRFFLKPQIGLFKLIYVKYKCFYYVILQIPEPTQLRNLIEDVLLF